MQLHLILWSTDAFYQVHIHFLNKIVLKTPVLYCNRCLHFTFKAHPRRLTIHWNLYIVSLYLDMDILDHSMLSIKKRSFTYGLHWYIQPLRHFYSYWNFTAVFLSIERSFIKFRFSAWLTTIQIDRTFNSHTFTFFFRPKILIKLVYVSAKLSDDHRFIWFLIKKFIIHRQRSSK